jgi:hypothetical protein
VCALLLALPVATQEEGGDIAFVAWVKVKAGMAQQFEEGRKQHAEWHRQQNDSTAWRVWEVISGKGTGVYGIGTFGHKWEDFDTPTVDEAADEANRQQTTVPYVESAHVQYWTALPKVSQPPPGEGPPAMSAVLFFHVHYGKAEDFNYLVGKFHKAIEKTNWPVHYEWYALVNGGEQPTYALVLPRENWAAFKPLEKPFAAMLEEAYGRQEAQGLLKRFGKVVRKQTSHISKNRPDLSYIPSGQ